MQKPASGRELLDQALRYFNEMVAAGKAPHLSVCNTLIEACAHAASKDALEGLPESAAHHRELALQLFNGMIGRRTWPTSTTFAALARACESAELPAALVAAVEAAKRGGVLKASAGYDTVDGRLSLWPKDALAKDTEWRCAPHFLPAVGAALAQYHLSEGRLTPSTPIRGPELALRAALTVQRSAARLAAADTAKARQA